MTSAAAVELSPRLSWTMIVRNAEATLEACLRSLRARTPEAEIVVVDTMSRDRTPEIARAYTDRVVRWRGPRGVWDEDMPWFDDAAAARQHALELATGQWVGWIDADDRLPGPEEAQRLLELNGRWKPADPATHIVDPSAPPRALGDLLGDLERDYPEADVVWCPYLYARDADGQAQLWQERERIVRRTDPMRWRWAEKAHEILVPVRGHTPRYRVHFAHLLFLHEKTHSEAAHAYSVARHYDVLSRQYEAGERTTRRCLYLAQYASLVAPLREPEYLAAAHEAATTFHDRYRTAVATGQMHVRQGLFRDALEALAAATHLRPDLPDAWVLGGQAWARAEDWPRAIEWLERGLACATGSPESEVNPRHHAIRYPTLLAEAYQRHAQALVRAGGHEDAGRALQRAVALSEAVVVHPGVGADSDEAGGRLTAARAAALAQLAAVALGTLAQTLFRHDEPVKAAELLRAVPWMLLDHPIVRELEQQVAPVLAHVRSEDAYLAHYASTLQTGAVPSPESWLDAPIARARWIAEWLVAHRPDAVVLDLGCYDGILGIPLLQSCPGIRYVGVDVAAEPLARLAERLRERGLAGRAVLHQVRSIRELARFRGVADVTLWCEVLEHVPDPARDLAAIAETLRPGGQLFVTTPWGSYDCGAPPDANAYGHARGHLGHIRALTPREVDGLLDGAGLRAEDLFREAPPLETRGHGLHVRASRRPLVRRAPVSVYVPSALWDWHGRQVHAAGMGASEKSIVLLAEHLAGGRRVGVYGPVPDPDTYRGVGYWPREHLRHAPRTGPVIVSRSPSSWSVVRTLVGPDAPLVLWLQDAWYPDLSSEVAAKYARIVVVSEWHRQTMHAQHGVPLDAMTVIPNPIDPTLYDGDAGARVGDRLIYASSPDRGLVRLLSLWPEIRQRLPGATLAVYYGWRGCERLALGHDPAWAQRYESARRAFERLRWQPGVEISEMVAPAVLARAWSTAGVWAYPTDFAETFGTVAVEARAGGCVPVCPPLAGLAESAACPETIWTPPVEDAAFADAFLAGVVRASAVAEDARRAMAHTARAAYDVARLADRWDEVLA